MGRIIINNRSNLSDLTALELVSDVIKIGRISNNDKQYCYLSSFKIEGKEHHIVTDLRKKSDSFIIYEVPQNNS